MKAGATGRVIEHWHTGTMTRNCRELRRANSEAVAEIHPADAEKAGVRTGDQVQLAVFHSPLEQFARLFKDLQRPVGQQQRFQPAGDAR